jgi:hypothetical protein
VTALPLAARVVVCPFAAWCPPAVTLWPPAADPRPPALAGPRPAPPAVGPLPAPPAVGPLPAPPVVGPLPAPLVVGPRPAPLVVGPLPAAAGAALLPAGAAAFGAAAAGLGAAALGFSWALAVQYPNRTIAEIPIKLRSEKALLIAGAFMRLSFWLRPSTRLLDVGDLAADECHLNILVEIDFFRPNLGDLRRLSKIGDYVIFCLS